MYIEKKLEQARIRAREVDNQIAADTVGPHGSYEWNEAARDIEKLAWAVRALAVGLQADMDNRAPNIRNAKARLIEDLADTALAAFGEQGCENRAGDLYAELEGGGKIEFVLRPLLPWRWEWYPKGASHAAKFGEIHYAHDVLDVVAWCVNEDGVQA